MKNIKIILLLVFLASIFSTCKKYEDGPVISLRTKHGRITGKYSTESSKSWDIEKYLVNGIDSTQALKSRANNCDHPPITFSQIKDQASRVGYGNCSEVGTSATWSLIDSKQKIRIIWQDTLNHPAYPPSYLSNNPRDCTWDIIRLTNKDMWLRTIYNNTEHYIELKH